MENNLLKGLKTEENKTFTENNAQAYRSTLDDLVDFFSVAGALRGRAEDEVRALFIKAIAQDELLATKALFYTRDIRDGLGERKTFQTLLNYLGHNYPDIARKNIALVPEFGRWDDLYCLIGTPVEKDMWALLVKQFKQDLWNYRNNKPISLMAKWLPSTNATNKQARTLGELTAGKLGMNISKYRKTMAKFRKRLKVTEVDMCANQWENIEYPTVPSIAMKNYRDAFHRQDEDRFEQYLDKLKSGEAKINAGTLYPYNITEAYGIDAWGRKITTFKNYDEVLEQQWKALPNLVDIDDNILIMADTSGSMMGRPLHTSIGLAIYFAERNKGAFANHFITFSSEPRLIELKGNSLYDRIHSVPAIVENTNIEKALDLVLNTAIDNELGQEEMPKAIVIISDMEFDRIHNNRGYAESVKWGFYEKMKYRYKTAGFEIPNLVFWNVDSRNDVFHSLSDYEGVQLASGQSINTFKQILNGYGKTPYESVLEVLNRPIYDCIRV